MILRCISAMSLAVVVVACSSSTTTQDGNKGTTGGAGTPNSCTIGPAPVGQCPAGCKDLGKISVKADGVFDHDYCTGPCTTSDACPENYRCNGSYCMPACFTSADCPSFSASGPNCNHEASYCQ